jgi:hypothetical protein
MASQLKWPATGAGRGDMAHGDVLVVVEKKLISDVFGCKVITLSVFANFYRNSL